MGEKNLSILFNITNNETALQFLHDLLGINEEDLLMYIWEKKTLDETNGFIQHFRIDLESLDISAVEAVSIHVTTNNDRCETIKKYGLLNLQNALTMETPIKRYLKSYGLEFDIGQNIMCVDEQLIDITFNKKSFSIDEKEEQLWDISRKIYNDFHIDGFFHTANYKDYGGYVHEKPEFLHNLKVWLEVDSIERDWINNNQGFAIKYKAPLDHYIYYSFYDTIEEYQDDYHNKLMLKEWLINKAIEVVWSHLKSSKLSDIYSYMKNEVSIPYCDILEMTEVKK